jgi:hypothetical protein
MLYWVIQNTETGSYCNMELPYLAHLAHGSTRQLRNATFFDTAKDARARLKDCSCHRDPKTNAKMKKQYKVKRVEMVVS